MMLSEILRLLHTARLPDAIDENAFGRIKSYFQMRSEWSQTHNVAGPQSMRTPWELDLPDAVAAREALHPTLPLVDVGTGSGTPGVLIGCLQPDRPIFLVEPIAKRTAFLRVCVAKIGLKNVRVVRGRWPCAVAADTAQVISRAVVSPEDWPALASSRDGARDHIVRMLAAQRPALGLANYTLDGRVEYALGVHGERVVERWAPIDEDD